MTLNKSRSAAAAAVDALVPDAVVRAELDISAMTAWRWDHDPAMQALGWPPPVRTKPNGPKKRSRKQLEAFKGNLVQRAIAERGRAVTGG